ncbi:MAG: TfoX/Sxy family protein [Nocardioidaceae bacterium]|nr:TfoX/Sxy family protein [Nocardioidaceae bacterium]
MAYDDELAGRLRGLLHDEPTAAGHDLGEKKMFGGLAFLVGGNMAIAVVAKGGVMVRVRPEETDSLIATTAAFPMEMRGREMTGWLRVGAEDLRTERQLSAWVGRGARYAASLPPK